MYELYTILKGRSIKVFCDLVLFLSFNSKCLLLLPFVVRMVIILGIYLIFQHNAQIRMFPVIIGQLAQADETVMLQCAYSIMTGNIIVDGTTFQPLQHMGEQFPAHLHRLPFSLLPGIPPCAVKILPHCISDTKPVAVGLTG